KLLAVVVDGLDDPRKTGERSVRNLDRLAHEERHFVFLFALTQFVYPAEDARHFLWTERRGNHAFAVLLGVAEEAEYIGRVAKNIRNFSHHRCFDKYVARIRHLFLADFLPVTDGIYLFRGNQHLRNVLFQVGVVHHRLDVLLHLFFLSADGAYHVPLPGLFFTHNL